jgi:hypothetical protein
MTIPARPSAGFARHTDRGTDQRTDVGLTAFGLAVALVLLLLAGMLLANLPTLSGQGISIVPVLWLVQSCGTILSFLLGCAAVITGRGRGWGIGAMVLSALGNAYVWLLISSSLSSNG